MSAIIGFIKEEYFPIAVGIIAIYAIYKVIKATATATAAVVEWKTTVENNQESTSKSITNIEGTLSKISDDIKKLFGLVNRNPTIQPGSRLMLTEFGEKLAENIEVNTWISSHADKLKMELVGYTPYEIQEECFRYAQNDLMQVVGEEHKTKIQSVAFDNGIDLASVLNVVGIVLRDKLLEIMDLEMTEE